MEKEFVGKCAKCQTDIYCNSGFIEGVVQEDKTLLCFDCSNEREKGNIIVSFLSIFLYALI